MKQLTIVIASLNEGEETLQTIQSIYDTANPELFRIILFNDGSDPKLWVEIPEEFKEVEVITHQLRKGAPYCFDKGVDMADTNYIAIFNARMRFKKGWMEAMFAHMNNSPETIYCTTSVVLDENGEFTKEKRYGAEIHEQENGLLEPIWKKAERRKVYEIPCILGANYFMHRKWYKYIRGFLGQEYYGGICVFLSLKSWALGGNVILIKDVEIGNKYRTDKPYNDVHDSILWNKILIAFLLLPFERAESMFHRLRDSEYYDILKNRLIHKMEFIVAERNRINKLKRLDITHLIIKKNGSSERL